MNKKLPAHAPITIFFKEEGIGLIGYAGAFSTFKAAEVISRFFLRIRASL